MAEFGSGISIERMIIKDLHTADITAPSNFEEGNRSHRHEGHSFFLVEDGTVQVEIDFQTYIMKSSSVIYVHPDQVHRILSLENVTVSSWAITDENLNPDYLKLLQGISPAKPLVLSGETFSIISEAVALCLKFTQRKTDKLYHSLLKDSCNALVALAISQYLASAKPVDRSSRSEFITKTFRELLEHNYTKLKGPSAYARHLNISTPYLNECVKSITGFSVTHHLQQRVILEAKRLLYYSDESVKEIAATLGYDDYPYFSRLFTKVTGMTALAFRSKNLD
ncbi:MAG: AraC family transcriptional regulator [Sphingobacteriaceae bacterium]|nr:MAG: AraC family transcriptional regulator [Sphingobacteriaceae bacterium]